MAESANENDALSSQDASSTETAANVISHDTWECVNCGEFYEGGQTSPDGGCAWCGDLAGWKRLWKVECSECGLVFHDVDKQAAIREAEGCDHDVPWASSDGDDDE